MQLHTLINVTLSTSEDDYANENKFPVMNHYFTLFLDLFWMTFVKTFYQSMKNKHNLMNNSNFTRLICFN